MPKSKKFGTNPCHARVEKVGQRQQENQESEADSRVMQSRPQAAEHSSDTNNLYFSTFSVRDMRRDEN